MRVVLDGRYIQDHFPGIARYTFNLARSLGDVAANDSIIVLYDPTVPNQRYDLDSLRAAPKVSLQPIVAPVFSPVGFLRLIAVLRSLRPDVYHSPYFLKPPDFSGPSVVTIFDLIAEHRPPIPTIRSSLGPWRALFHLAVRVAVDSAARIIVPSQATSFDLQTRHSHSIGKIRTIPLGVDRTFRSVDVASIAEVRDRYRLPAAFVLCVGINKPHKNLDAGIRALLHPDLATAKLVSAGPIDPRFPSATHLALNIGVGDRVLELGALPEADLPALYAAASVLLCLSLDEGFGLTPLEAMACGTPVVAANLASLPEIVGDGGILVDPRDDSHVAQAIHRILDRTDIATALRAAGFRQAAGFSWTDTARATLAVYREVAPAR